MRAWASMASPDSALMRQLDQVWVPKSGGSVSYADLQKITMVQAVWRGRVARRKRLEEEAAVIAIQVSGPCAAASGGTCVQALPRSCC